ncbi:amino acid ABC transporter substrate-binding protein [Amaricoccus macauensis]|uniref:amino acid ABC transporter substrate-binding protein n=1 Tax=Amaricoccus macauensis TaxID=57001 RepID=UPI003C7A8E01
MRRAVSIALALFATFAALPTSAQTIDRIKETGELRLGFRTDAAPLSYLGEGNQPRGYTPMLCARVAELLAIDLDLDDLTANFIPVTTENRFEKVANGEIDLLCGAATITIERRAQVDFSLPVFVDGTAVLMPIEAERDLSELEGKSIGVRSGTTTQEILTNSLEAAELSAEIIGFEDHEAGLAALENGEISAYFGDQSILYGLFYRSDMSERFAISDNTLTVEKQGLALRRGDADFRLAVDRALSHLYSNGTVEQTFADNFAGAQPGLALQALFLIAPELP